MKRRRNDDSDDSDSNNSSSYISRNSSDTTSSTPGSKKDHLATSLIDDSVSLSTGSIEQIHNTQINVEEAMTQVDERWNKNKRRRRTVDRMTQAPIGTSITPDDESPSQAGVIEKLELFNFMCHSAFSLKFGPQTNFIIGRNGSGKSAVLTGISVALGAKATDTDRGNSLKNLIMHGKNVARAIVTLKNEGPEAYMPEEFGSRIIIERVLKNDRPHSLMIKNSSGKTISTTKKTIDKILEYFGITIANPMTILTQTEAKTFLAHSSDKDKFNSFMAGTRLKESFENIKDIENNVNEIKDILNKNKDVYDEMKQAFQEAKNVWNSFKDSDKYSKKKGLLIGKKIWLQHNEQEKLFAKANSILEKKATEIESNNEKKQILTNEILQMEEKKKSLESGELENYKQKTRYCEGEKNDAQTLINRAKENLDTSKRKIDTIKEKIASDDQILSKVDKKIQTERKRIENSSEENVERLRLFQEKQQDKLKRLNDEKASLASNIEVLQPEIKSTEAANNEALRLLNGDIRNLEAKVFDARKQQQSNTPESAFNGNIQKLMRDLTSQKFEDGYMGPLGLYIELKKEYKNWSSVLESILQRSMISFLVSNHRDAQSLGSRTKFFGTGSEIIVRKNEVFNYDQYKPKSTYPSILDVLQISDDNLKCFLVDSLKAHSTLLIPDRMEAQRELDNDHQNKISSVICFVENGVLRLYKRNDKFQTDPIYLNFQVPARLRVEGDSLYLRLQRDLDQLKKSTNEKNLELNSKLQSLVNDLRAHQKRAGEIKTEIKEISQSIEKTIDKLEKLQSGTSKLDSLLNEKDILESNRALDIQTMEPLQSDFHKAQKVLENQKLLYQSIVTDFKNAQKLYMEKEKEFQSFNSNIEFNKSNILSLDNANHKLETDLNKLNEYISKTTEELKMFKERALEFCTLEEANLTSTTTVKSIDDEVHSIDVYLKEIESRQGITKEQAELNLLKANSELKEIEAKFSETISLYNNLSEALENRLSNLLQTTYLTFQEVESVFISALKIRRFRGKIEFNVKKGTLTLKVATKETGPLRSVESFSGGEKSYGQIAFLFAIWGPMHSRIRGLDEFDVFMDNVNRRIALKLILNKVAENPKRQTIFITPLGVAGVEGLDKESVNIHEISPPERANL